MTSSFFLAAFTILILSLTFENLVILYHDVDLLRLILFGVFLRFLDLDVHLCTKI